MADILPPYNPRVRPSVQTRGRASPAQFSAASDALPLIEVANAANQLGGTLGQIEFDRQARVSREEKERLERERKVKLAATRNEARQRNTLGLLDDFNTAKQEAQPGADGFYETFQATVQKRREAEMAAIPADDPDMRMAVEQDFDRIALPVLIDAQEFQATEGVRYRSELLDGSLNAMGNAIISSPDRFDDYYQQGLASIEDASEDLSPEGRRKMIDGWKDSASMAAFNGMLEADPYQALEDARSKRFDHLWAPETKARAINAAQSEVKRREAEAKAVAAENLRRVGRQLDGAIKVMQAGYEYDDIAQLRAAVKGTEFEAELAFHEGVADIRQEHAFRPVSEQIEMLRQIEGQPQNEASLSMIKALQPVTEEAVKAVQSNKVLEYAADHGVVSLEPVDYGNAESWGNRLRRSDAAAEMAGIGQANVLTEQETADLAGFVSDMPAPEKIQWMADLRASLDDHDYRRVQETMSQAKIEPGLGLAADMIARSEKNQTAAQRLLQAFAVDEKALPLEKNDKKAAQDSAQAAFADGLGSVLVAQADVLSSDAGRLNMMSEMNEATRRLALSYAASGRGGGFFGGGAGDTAYDDLFGDYQAVTDEDAILFVEPTVGDVDDIADGLRSIRQENAAEALAWQKPAFLLQHGEQNGELLFDEYVRDIQEGGVWVNGQGGAVLVDPVQGAVIVRPDGTPYVVSFDEAIEASKELPADVNWPKGVPGNPVDAP